MNFKFTISIIFLSLYLNAQTQLPHVSVINGDTVIVFSFSQGLELTMRNEKLKKNKELNKALNYEIVKKDSIIDLERNNNKKQQQIIESNYIIINNKDELIGLCEKEKEDLKRELKSNKIQKWVAYSLVGITALLGIVF